MRKLIYTLLFLSFSAGLHAQLTFETLPLNGKNYWKGDSGIVATNYFQAVSGSSFAKFKNRNDTSSFGDYWSGYAFSKLKDSVSVSYATNDCAAFPASGHNNSDVYVVAYENTFEPELNTIILNHGINSMYVTNSTIAYRSMELGDGLAKKFGGSSGNDPDYFRIVFSAWSGGTLLADTVQFYLADFRDSNNVNDYIIKDWQKVDFKSKFFNADSITYHLESSDTNAFGILTPTYFCIDDMELTPLSTETIDAAALLSFYPNPCVNDLNIRNPSNETFELSVYSLQGSYIGLISVSPQSEVRWHTASLANGIYLIKQLNATSSKSTMIIKQ